MVDQEKKSEFAEPLFYTFLEKCLQNKWSREKVKFTGKFTTEKIVSILYHLFEKMPKFSCENLTLKLSWKIYDSDSFVFPQYLHNKKRNDKNIKFWDRGVFVTIKFSPFLSIASQPSRHLPNPLFFFFYFFSVCYGMKQNKNTL